MTAGFKSGVGCGGGVGGGKLTGGEERDEGRGGPRGLGLDPLTVMQMPGFQWENEASPLLLSGQGLSLLPPIE